MHKVLIVGLLLAGCGSSNSGQVRDLAESEAKSLSDSDTTYSTGVQTRDGIGKYYMGREISHVMGHLGAGWLERSEREAEERTDLVVGGMSLDSDAVVADIGAGTGYFSFRIAEVVPKGRVVAVDIQQEMLSIVEAKKAQLDVSNVETLLSTTSNPGLEPQTYDAAIIVDAYHEFDFPREMVRGIWRGLKPGGRFFLLEYRAEDPQVPIKPLHKMSEAQAIKEITSVGFEHEETKDFLPQQHFLVFRKAQ